MSSSFPIKMSSRGVMAAHMGMGWGMMEESGWRKGPWTSEEDRLLIEYVRVHGEGRWNSVARLAGLRRNGKSCRLRWVNYLRPDLKRGQITPHEESIIVDLHARWGNRWSTIARSLPGRTDNEIKNYWRTHFKKKAKTTSHEVDKSKTRLLRKQQFHQQQQQQQYQYQLQQQQQEFTTLDMKKIMSLLDNGEDKGFTTCSLPQTRHNICPTTTYEDQQVGIFYSNMLNNNNGDTSTSEASTNNEDLIWDRLWNMDDLQGNYLSAMCATSKVGMHVGIDPFC